MGNMDGKRWFCNSIINMAASEQVAKLTKNGVSIRTSGISFALFR